MKNILKHSIIYFLVALIILATGGIRMLQQGCIYDGGENIIRVASLDMTLVNADGCCGLVDEEPEDNCCNSENGSKGKKQSCPSADACCYVVYTFFKTDPVNLINPIQAPLKYHITCLVNQSDDKAGYKSEIQLHKVVSNPSPPLLYGKELLTSLHMLKTDPLQG